MVDYSEDDVYFYISWLSSRHNNCWVYGGCIILYHVNSLIHIISIVGWGNQRLKGRPKCGAPLEAFKDPAFPRDRLVELLKLVAAKGGATELADVLQLVTKSEAHGR